MRTDSELFNHLLEVVSSKRFLKMQGLGNEVPFYICPFPVSKTKDMKKLVGQLIKKLQQKGIQVLSINLYDLSIEILQDRGIFEQIIDIESTLTKGELKETLQGTLDPETHLVPAIADRMKETPFDVLFISGVGEVFPYIRSHNVLNNLQSTVTNQPMVMFFPGEYNHTLAKGASLDLFDRLHDDKYYRAFNINKVQV